jgi:hypothetical protein
MSVEKKKEQNILLPAYTPKARREKRKKTCIIFNYLHELGKEIEIKKKRAARC